MAIRKIEIDTNRLGQTVQDMTELLASVRNQSDLIYQDVMELDGMWDGRANMAFNRQFLQDRARLGEICNDLKLYAQKMDMAREEYEVCENAVADIVNAI